MPKMRVAVLSGYFIGCVLVVLTGYGCRSAAPVHESLSVRFHSVGRHNGGFVCYRSKFAGWLCEFAADGHAPIAMHIDPQVSSMGEMFELLRRAARAVSRDGAADDYIVDVEYIHGDGVHKCRTTGLTRIHAMFRWHAAVTHLYRQGMDKLPLAKEYWFRSLAPSLEDTLRNEYGHRR